MDNYEKHIVIGVVSNYLIMTIACIVFSKPGTGIIASRFDACQLCIFLGWFSVILNLIFPAIIITVSLWVARLKHYKLSPFFISSFLILYPLWMIVFQKMFNFYEKDGGLWQSVILGAMSFAGSILIDRKLARRRNAKNS